MKIVQKGDPNLSKIAVQLFTEVFRTIDAEIAVSKNISLVKSTLYICGESFDLNKYSEIYVISFGKAAIPMAISLNKVLSKKISAGIVSAPESKHKLPSIWRVFFGGHPFPNKESIESALASVDLLKRANHPKSLIIFLISGGGSAMLELPKSKKISLEDLKKTNQILVSCGATINEINKFRRAISQIKGGGLSQIAPFARQVSLIISDTNKGDVESVASGPTILPHQRENLIIEAFNIAKKFQIKNSIPKTVLEFLEESNERNFPISSIEHSFHTLLDNKIAVETIAKSAEKLGFIIQIADDLVENPIEKGCYELVKRLLKLRVQNKGKKVAIISGGEFICPVRGKGIGGRNLETVFRCLLEIERQTNGNLDFSILSGGTDGIDGNSPAAGAVADQTSLKRAKELGLNTDNFLENSDSYNFFKRLDETIETGATGTNVRDLRILLSR